MNLSKLSKCDEFDSIKFNKFVIGATSSEFKGLLVILLKKRRKLTLMYSTRSALKLFMEPNQLILKLLTNKVKIS